MVKTTADFIRESKEVHGELYNYNKCIYRKYSEPVVLVCKVHGEFRQTPNNHLSGSGCLKCARVLIGSKLRSTVGEFVRKAKVVHGSKYNYSKSVYVGVRDKLTIQCSKHGEFRQTPNNHLSGSGCLKCSYEFNTNDLVKRYTKSKKGKLLGTFYILHFVHILGFEFLKIGITSVGVSTRYKSKYKDFKWVELLSLKMTNLQTAELERNVLNEFCPDFKMPQGVDFQGRTECYQTNRLSEITEFVEKNT